jgi:putative glutathione S-transferase
MGGRLVEGQWTTKSNWEQSEDGAFQRQESVFRDTVGGDAHPVAPGRYHLYVSHACPWAHRTLITRALLGLDDAISVSVVHPHMTGEGWHFGGADDAYPTPDHLYGKPFLRELYTKADPQFTGRVTVPILWDRERETIVNNESREIIVQLNDAFRPLATRERDLYPSALRPTIDAAIDAIYPVINNGVYRCGFAAKESAYQTAFDELFSALDHWDQVLATQRFTCGDSLTLADICLFTTLFRFDSVYYVHFKCNGRHIYEYAHLWRFVRDVYQTEGVAETCHLDHIKLHYYRSHLQLNPRGFVPVGPTISFDEPVVWPAP